MALSTPGENVGRVYKSLEFADYQGLGKFYNFCSCKSLVPCN